MSNSKKHIKIPTKEGLAQARKKLKEMRRKDPSPELVKIIADIAEQQDKAEQEKDIAARSHSSDLGV